MDTSFAVDWKKVDGLLPVVVQDSLSKEVLMLAYMNEEAYGLTCRSGYAHYFSRTKQRLWKKGESSGHVQKVDAIFLDCDNDTLLLHVTQTGVACHTGRPSCFFNRVDTGEVIGQEDAGTVAIYGVIDHLYHVINERKLADPQTSYVAKLYAKGENTLLKKVAEEAAEFCFAIKDDNTEEAIYEAADLLFHTLVALGYRDIHPDRVKQELARRFGLSGIEEKNARGHGNT
ncbi:MAG: bifunctional phosphoribosyl-AMP cyclohydrolase/phosphoribosyl-ATP diphosphatase HisIE [Campylobacterales bacterium]|nr:bifunctional phosphoribosyl-AMP cyclohydrolase/phosphoribosyl-ATP diphosphatase HisIE [Campylobacterales bacterium]